MKKFIRKNWVDFVAVPIGLFVFAAPFILIFLTSTKNAKESYQFNFQLGEKFLLWQNIKTVLQTSDGVVIRAFINSTILTVVSVTLVVFVSSMAAFVFARRPGKLTTLANIMVLAGLVVPPAVVPTIWVLQRLHLFKTMPGLIFIEVAYSAAFSILIYKGFIASIPREIDEAAASTGIGIAELIAVCSTFLFPSSCTKHTKAISLLL